LFVFKKDLLCKKGFDKGCFLMHFLYNLCSFKDSVKRAEKLKNHNHNPFFPGIKEKMND